MTWATLIRRGLTHYARSHLGVLAGAVIATAALTGALVLGDSVRAGLRAAALGRLGPTHYAVQAGDRFFAEDLAERVRQAAATEPSKGTGGNEKLTLTTALLLPGMVTTVESSRTAPRVQVLGVDAATWPAFAGWSPDVSTPDWLAGDQLLMNEALAAQLACRPGDWVVVRVRKPGWLADDAALTPKDDHTVALRLTVGRVLTREELGEFNLRSGRPGQATAFLPLARLAASVEQSGRANLLLAGPANGRADSTGLPALTRALQAAWKPDDAGLVVRALPAAASAPAQIEVSSRRIFLEEPVVASLVSGEGCGRDRRPVFTYLANLMQVGERTVPYSMVTATSDPELVPAGLRDDEIIVNDWLARELGAQPGDTLDLSYYLVESGSNLTERTNRFRVRAVVPLTGVRADRALMPEFPGIARAESTRDWDTGFPLRYAIRPADEQYWRQYRGTPKAFITLAAGQRLWSNRFGSLTALRFPVPAGKTPADCQGEIAAHLRASLPAAALGLRFEAVRAEALLAADQAQDFGQLFLGFSFFLVLAALLLLALLFRFALEQRAGETGLLLAVGFRPARAVGLMVGEGLALAAVGGLLGAAVGSLYARALLAGLAPLWREAAGGLRFQLQLAPASLVTGAAAGVVVAGVTLWLSARGFVRRPAALLAGETTGGAPGRPRRTGWLALVCAGAGLLLVLSGLRQTGPGQAPVFFMAGALLLTGGLFAAASGLAWLGAASTSALTLSTLGARGADAGAEGVSPPSLCSPAARS